MGTPSICSAERPPGETGDMPEHQDLSAAASEEYDRIAEVYERISEDNLANALFERPVIRSLLPRVTGRRVLDAGCAAGAHSEWLANEGADVVAIDLSPRMVQRTRERLAGRGDARVHDLREPLDFLENGSIDVVLSSLTIHYIDELAPAFREFRRVLTPDGSFVFSTHHPFIDWEWFGMAGYYEIGIVQDHWENFDATLSFRRRTMEEIMRALEDTGFLVRRYREPRPDPAAIAAHAPDDPEWVTKPTFLFVEAVPAR
jgi:SAM-dependent methyltransferase